MKNYVVIGAGRFGESLALALMDFGNDVIVIDKNEDIVNKISPYVTHAVCADTNDSTVFEKLGLANVDTAIVSMGSSLEASVLATLALKELGVKHVICKAKTVMHSNIFLKLGADEVVIPEHDMGRKLAFNLENSNIADFFNIAGDHSIVEMYCPKTWIGSSLADLNIRSKYGINVLGIIRDIDDFIGNPSADTILEADDKLLMLGKAEDFAVVKDLNDEE